MTELVIGADIGGTSTRIGVADRSGRVLALAEGGAGNPNVVGVGTATVTIRLLVEEALRGLDGVVSAAVLGMAGGSRLADEPGALAATMPSRVTIRPELVSDLAVAFCSATPARSGYVLVAGTGAVSGEVRGNEVEGQRDGWGWLLGDEGAGFWLGRAAVRATLSTLQNGGDLRGLPAGVLAATGTSDLRTLVQHCYAEPPIGLARLASLVTSHATDDPRAAAIAARSVELLSALVLDLQPVPQRPVVLAGSVVAAGGPIGAAVAGRLTNPVLRASHGVVGALWTALRSRHAAGPEVHTRLSTTLPRGG